MPTPKLDDRQREIAGRPENIRLATAIAKRYAKSFPKFAEDLPSVASLGLCYAAACFDQTRRVSFGHYATIRIHGTILDYLRIELKAGRPFVATRGHKTNSGEPVADDLPVGWEMESIDEVIQLTRGCLGPSGDLLRAYLIDARYLTMQQIADANAISLTSVSRLIHDACITAFGEHAMRGGFQYGKKKRGR